jgi:hypothetical protein
MTLQANLLGTAEYLRQAQAGLPSTGLTATGNSLATALQLQTDFCVFTTVAASTGCTLLGTVAAATGPCLPVDSIIVVNHGANTLTVYPFAATGKIANGSAGAGFSVSATKMATFVLISGGPDVWAASVSA